MLIICCPYCGPRDEVEFHYGGEAYISRPSDSHQLTDKQWGEYLFMRANTKGWHAERWSHSAGCRRWFNIERNTITNEIRSVSEFNNLAALSLRDT